MGNQILIVNPNFTQNGHRPRPVLPKELLMSVNDNSPSAQASVAITVVGKLPQLSASNLARMAAFLVEGNTVLAESPVTSNGFRFRLGGTIVINPCLVVVLGPKGLDEQTLL